MVILSLFKFLALEVLMGEGKQVSRRPLSTAVLPSPNPTGFRSERASAHHPQLFPD
jgi:hypothetical protein